MIQASHQWQRMSHDRNILLVLGAIAASRDPIVLEHAADRFEHAYRAATDLAKSIANAAKQFDLDTVDPVVKILKMEEPNFDVLKGIATNPGPLSEVADQLRSTNNDRTAAWLDAVAALAQEAA